MQEYAAQAMAFNPTTERPPQRVRQTKEKRSKKDLVLAFAAGVAAALTVMGAGMWMTNGAAPPPDPILPDEGLVLTYRNKEVPVQEDVPVNQYQTSRFNITQNGWTSYLGKGVVARHGVDVSAYQKEIDWQQVADSGISFAMIRVGYRGYGTGVIWEDEYCRQNIEGALSAGLDVGVYFFSQALTREEVDEEIAFMLDIIEDYNINYPVVLDWEYVSDKTSRTYKTTGEEVTELMLYYSQVMDALGYQSAIYFNQDMAYLHLELNDLVDYPFWLAEYRTPPQFYYHFDMWQYSDSGVVPGINGRVDMNLAFTDMSEWSSN